MSSHRLSAVAAANARASKRVAYRALHRKYVGPPRGSYASVFFNLKQESFHALQAELP